MEESSWVGLVGCMRSIGTSAGPGTSRVLFPWDYRGRRAALATQRGQAACVWHLARAGRPARRLGRAEPCGGKNMPYTQWRVGWWWGGALGWSHSPSPGRRARTYEQEHVLPSGQRHSAQLAEALCPLAAGPRQCLAGRVPRAPCGTRRCGEFAGCELVGASHSQCAAWGLW